MKIKVLNGMPLGAVQGAVVSARCLSKTEAYNLVHKADEVESYIGHKDTAHILSGMLGRKIPHNRANARLEVGDVILVCAYQGPRLPEGATELPEGAKFTFWLVEVGEKPDLGKLNFLYNLGKPVRTKYADEKTVAEFSAGFSSHFDEVRTRLLKEGFKETFCDWEANEVYGMSEYVDPTYWITVGWNDYLDEIIITIYKRGGQHD